jgi:hypothetical protein
MGGQRRARTTDCCWIAGERRRNAEGNAGLRLGRPGWLIPLPLRMTDPMRARFGTDVFTPRPKVLVAGDWGLPPGFTRPHVRGDMQTCPGPEAQSYLLSSRVERSGCLGEPSARGDEPRWGAWWGCFDRLLGCAHGSRPRAGGRLGPWFGCAKGGHSFTDTENHVAVVGLGTRVRERRDAGSRCRPAAGGVAILQR